MGHQQAADDETDRGDALLETILELAGVEDGDGEREEEDVLQAEDHHDRRPQRSHRTQDRRLPDVARADAKVPDHVADRGALVHLERLDGDQGDH